MPMWLDLLRTPMAAPETERLRHMRRTWQILCLLNFIEMIALRPLLHIVGPRFMFEIGALQFTTAVYTILYGIRKHRADKAHLDEQLEKRS